MRIEVTLVYGRITGCGRAVAGQGMSSCGDWQSAVTFRRSSQHCLQQQAVPCMRLCALHTYILLPVCAAGAPAEAEKAPKTAAGVAGSNGHASNGHVSQNGKPAASPAKAAV